MDDWRYRLYAAAVLVVAAVLPLVLLPLPVAPQEAAPAQEQAGAEEAPAQAAAPEEPQPIPAAEIQARAQDLSNRLNDVNSTLGTDEELATARDVLDDLRGRFDRVSETSDSISESTVLARRIDDALNQWRELQARMAQPLDSVRERYQQLQGQVEGLGFERRVWLATQTNLSATDLPDDVAANLRARVGQVLVTLQTTAVSLQARSDQVLSLQNELESLVNGVGAEINRLEQLDANLRRRVLTRGAPPIWQIGSSEVAALGDEARDALSDRISVISRYLVDHSEEALAAFVAFLVFAGVGFGLRRFTPNLSQIEGAEALNRMVSRPFSLAAIFSLLAATWFFTSMPMSLVDLFMVVTLIPVMRLAPGLLAPEDRPNLYGLLALFAAMRVVSLMTDGSAVRRLSLLLLTVAAFVGLVRLVRYRLAAMIEGRNGWWRAAALVQRIAVPVLFAAIVANLIGWVRLSWVVTSGTIMSAYAAVILWLFAAGAVGLAAVLPQSHVGEMLPSLRNRARDVTRVLSIIVQMAAIWIWIDATGTWFLLDEPAREALRTLAGAGVELGGFQITLGQVVAAILVLIVAPLISRVVRFFFMEEVRPRLGLPIGSADGVASLMHYVILTIGVLVAASAAGFNATQLTVVAGALGVGIGFGLQNIVSNFISGLILIFERPIKVGDRISVGANQQMGVVSRIGIRASTVKTFDGSEIVVPNSDLISKEVTNWTLSDMSRRMEMPISVEYGTEPREVLEILEKCANDHPEVLDDPGAKAVFDGFGESALAFRLLYWVPGDNILGIKTEMSLAVNDALKVAGVKVAIPRRRLEMTNHGEGDG